MSDEKTKVKTFVRLSLYTKLKMINYLDLDHAFFQFSGLKAILGTKQNISDKYFSSFRGAKSNYHWADTTFTTPWR
jgi:hypothetical protein